MTRAGSDQSWPPFRPGGTRMSANPHANGGELLSDFLMPDFRTMPFVSRPRVTAVAEGHACAGDSPPRLEAQRANRNFRVFGPDETASNRPRCAIRSDGCAVGWPRPGRTMTPTSHRRTSHGDPERAHLPGLAGGISPHRAPRPLLLLRGLHPHNRLNVQPTCQMVEILPNIPWRRPIASLNYLLTSHVWRQDHNGFLTRIRVSSITS